MNVQFRCNEPFLPGYVDRIYVIFRILITFFFYPVNPVDPVRELRSDIKRNENFLVTVWPCLFVENDGNVLGIGGNSNGTSTVINSTIANNKRYPEATGRESELPVYRFWIDSWGDTSLQQM